MISIFQAQIAFLIHISFVLSVTDTNIIFITQIHQTTKEIQAIQLNKIVKVEVIDVKFFNISA
jgi:hypothetical protein